MNHPEHHDEENLERLLRASLEPAARPTPAERQAAWQRLQAAWKSQHGAAAAAAQKPAVNGVAITWQSKLGSMLGRVRPQQADPTNNTNCTKETIMRLLLRNRWGFGLGAAAAVAVGVLLFALATPKAQAKAAEVLARGAQAVAKLTTIHLKGQLRTLPADNFSYINPDQAFYPIELWKQFDPDLKWKIEKPGRVVVMDGQSTLMYIRSANEAVKLPQKATSAFDTDWLHRIANLSQTISNELNHAQAKGWKLDLQQTTGTDGKPKSVVTILATTDIPDNDYVKNSFFEDANTRRVYRFDEETERLEAVQIYLVRPNGSEVQIFELSQIDYNPPLAAKLWQVDLPANVAWYKEPEALPDNEKYASMSPEQAARAFFEACSREDWTEVAKFMSPVTEQLKEFLGGVQIVSLGETFSSKAYGGRFVPYEIKLKGGQVRKHNLALRKDNPAHRWQVDGGI